jgi:hypothetical protein
VVLDGDPPPPPPHENNRKMKSGDSVFVILFLSLLWCVWGLDWLEIDLYSISLEGNYISLLPPSVGAGSLPLSPISYGPPNDCSEVHFLLACLSGFGLGVGF